MNRSWSELIAWSITVLTALLGWSQWLHQLREKHARQKAETELALIKRRSSGPFFYPSTARFNNLYYDTDKPGETGFRPFGRGDMLDSATVELSEKVPENHEVFFVITASGEEAHEVSFKLDKEDVRLRREPELNDSNGLLFFSYKFRPEIRGEPQSLEVKFLSVSGIRDVHMYYTEHGRRILRRTDPN